MYVSSRSTARGDKMSMDDVTSLAQWTNSQFDPALNWKDVDWIKKIWPGKLIIKGILDVEDAKTAVKLGADAIVVSNHGGRQLDGAPSSISALPAIAQAVGSDTEVLFDGGIRTGSDMMIGVPQVMGMKPTFRSFFSMAPPLAKTSVAVFSGKNCDNAASAVEAPSDCRKARRPMSFGKSARSTAEATTVS